MRFEQGTIELTLGDQKFDAQYEKKIFETLEDVLKEAQGDGEKVTPEKATASILEKINLAEDWKRRLAARTEFLKDGDAAKAASIEAQVKAFIKAREKAGKPVTESQARAKVALMMED